MLISIDDGEARLLIELLRRAQDEEFALLTYQRAQEIAAKRHVDNPRKLQITKLISKIKPNL